MYPLKLLNDKLTVERLALEKYRGVVAAGNRKDIEKNIIKTHIPNAEKRIEELEKAIGILNKH